MFGIIKAKPLLTVSVVLVLIAGAVILVMAMNSQDLALNISELELEVGNFSALNVKKIDPELVTWTSSNPEVAMVNQKGSVMAVAPGTVTITAVAGDKEGTCLVTVNPPAIAYILLDKTNLTMVVGEENQLNLEVNPPAADFQLEKLWTSDNPEVAVVDSSGNVTAVGTGNTVIRVRIDEKEKSCELTVLLPLNLELVHTVPLRYWGHELLFSPNGKLFTDRYDVDELSGARVVDLAGNEYRLPGNSEFGPLFWSGSTVVYFGRNPSTNNHVIYVFDTEDHSYIQVANHQDYYSSLDFPVIKSNNILLAMFRQGLWSYDLATEQWTHKIEYDKVDLSMWKFTWSPDLDKFTWKDNSGIVILDVGTGNETVLPDMSATAIWSAIAWSQDSTRIAALSSTAEQIQIFSVQGEALESFSAPGVDHKDWSRMPRINWVPGHNKVSYVNKEAFIIVDLTDGTRWMSTEIGPQYAWLPDGRLAFAGEYDPNNGQLMYIVEIDWK